MYYKFVEKPVENPEGSYIFKLLQKVMNGEKLTTGTDDGWDGWKWKDEKKNYIQKPGYKKEDNDYVYFDEVCHSEAYRNGIYKAGGWIYDFRPYFKKYLVNWKNEGWREQFAPNKAFIRKCSCTPRCIVSIMEIDNEYANKDVQKVELSTLEDILALFGSKKPFLNEVIRNDDGSKDPFTKSGAVAYGKLTDLLYCVGNLVDVDVNEIIERLDQIANEDN